MLCQRCKKREATVHVTFIEATGRNFSPQGFCEACYSEFEAEKLKSYNDLTKPRPPLTVNVEQITGAEFLANRHHFKEISKQLDKLPQTRERLAFELLSMALNCLDRGEDPNFQIGLSGCLAGSVSQNRLSTYIDSLEKFLRRVIELLHTQTRPAHQRAFHFALGSGAVALWKIDEPRFKLVLTSLKRDYQKMPTDELRAAIHEIEATISHVEKRRRKRKAR